MSSINSHPKINVKLEGYRLEEEKKGHWAWFLAPRTQPLWSFLSCRLLFLVFCLDESRERERDLKGWTKTEKEKERVGEGGKTEIDRQRGKRKVEKMAGRGGGKGADWLYCLSSV